MKRHILSIAALLILCIGYLSCNKHDNIYFADLLSTAQAFLQKYFPDNLVASAERHSDEPCFEVTLDNGFEIDFYSDGRWQEIESHHAILPAELVQGVLPEKIRSYLEENYPLAAISSIERSSVGYAIELDVTPTTYIFFDLEGNVSAYEEH